MAYRKSKLSQRGNGQFQRTIGQAFNSQGQLRPKRFLLGTDRRQAEAAALLLERLWDLVVQDFERERQRELALVDDPDEEQWLAQHLNGWFADSTEAFDDQ